MVKPLVRTLSTSPPFALLVVMLAVLSPGIGGVMKRVTNTRAPSALTDTWRA